MLYTAVAAFENIELEVGQTWHHSDPFTASPLAARRIRLRAHTKQYCLKCDDRECAHEMEQFLNAGLMLVADEEIREGILSRT